MPAKFFRVDAFASRPYEGNPANVLIISKPTDTETMQSMAKEMDGGVTVFLLLSDSDALSNTFALRWFTATTELPLCGHGTMAAAHTLFATGIVEARNVITFTTKSAGDITASLSPDGRIDLDFARRDVTPCDVPDNMLEVLGVDTDALWCGKTETHIFIQLRNELDVLAAQPDFPALATTGAEVILFALAESESPYAYAYRMFAPTIGVNEDHVSASPNCALASHLLDDGEEVMAYSASERGGFLSVRRDGDRVHLLGRAVTVLKGVWMI